ncbi:MAG: hypothetical protein R6X35_09250 [Candidatus Krumholzibacteriia bacterium]
MARHTRSLALFLFLVLALGSGACASPKAEPAAAATEPRRPFSGAATPGGVLARLEAAVAARDSRDYAECLADTFRFVPHLAVVAAYPAIPWHGWGRALEAGFARWLCHPAHGATLSLVAGVLERGSQAGGHSWWEVVYAIDTRGDRFGGRATLGLVERNQSWYLESWEDTGPAPDATALEPTSGEARALSTR